MEKQEYIKRMLESAGIKKLNEMQIAMHEACSKDNDIVLLSPTGSGKTIAFLIPAILSVNPDRNEAQVLIVTPSRELAIQIEHVFKSLSSGLRIGLLYGGHNINIEEKMLENPPHVIVGTPGRLCDHIRSGNFYTEDIKTLILDEFDKTLEYGFTDEMEEIMSNLRRLKKKFLISATEAVEIPVYTKIENPARINFISENVVENNLKIFKVISPEKDKLETLFKLICNVGNNTSLVFCNHRESVDRISSYLRKKGILCETFHGGMDQDIRERSLCLFRNGSRNILISTDLAARGLDIPEIQNVIHYHLPTSEDAFTHRNGRTARMNAEGSSYIILNSSDKMPDFIDEKIKEKKLDENAPLPKPTEWECVYIGRGKKNKISKGDIAGFLFQKGNLQKDELGIIIVKEQYSLVAVKRSVIKNLISRIKDEKIKGQKTKFEIARQ